MKKLFIRNKKNQRTPERYETRNGTEEKLNGKEIENIDVKSFIAKWATLVVARRL